MWEGEQGGWQVNSHLKNVPQSFGINYFPMSERINLLAFENLAHFHHFDTFDCSVPSAATVILFYHTTCFITLVLLFRVSILLKCRVSEKIPPLRLSQEGGNQMLRCLTSLSAVNFQLRCNCAMRLWSRNYEKQPPCRTVGDCYLHHWLCCMWYDTWEECATQCALLNFYAPVVTFYNYFTSFSLVGKDSKLVTPSACFYCVDKGQRQRHQSHSWGRCSLCKGFLTVSHLFHIILNKEWDSYT